jgi:hypothetical protein
MTPEESLFELLRGAMKLAPTASTEGSPVEQDMAVGDPDFGTPVTVRNIFTHHDAHPIVLDFALLKTFGLSWLGWEAETIWAEIQRLFKTQISELARAKIQTVKTLHISNGPWEQWQVFEKIIQGLNNNIPRWEYMQAPNLDQLYAGVDIMESIRVVDFSDEVKGYMAASILHEDVTFCPHPLDLVQVEVAQPYYLCKDCGNQDDALFHDGICDTCSRKFDQGNGLGFLPDPEMLLAGRGKNTTLMLKFDPDPVQRLWDTVKDKKTVEVADSLDDTPEGVQVAKLLLARDYANIRRKQLADQLISLKTWLGAV